LITDIFSLDGANVTNIAKISISIRNEKYWISWRRASGHHVGQKYKDRMVAW
jgi:hypothetical protein